MAARVLASGGDLLRAVVCDDVEVAAWARQHQALVLWEPGRGLNGAVQEGVRLLRARGAGHVVVAAGDLPLAEDLSWVAAFEGITLVPDRRGEGTNVIGVPPDVDFGFSYGPGSFARHLAIATATGAEVRVEHVPSLALDVDLPEDLAAIGS